MLFLRTSLVSALLFSSTLVQSHPVHDEDATPQELARRQVYANKRHIRARNCGAQVAQMRASRKAKRSSLAKRQQASSTSSAAAAHYTTIQNVSHPKRLQCYELTVIYRPLV